jgi:hypothetical protein
VIDVQVVDGLRVEIRQIAARRLKQDQELSVIHLSIDCFECAAHGAVQRIQGMRPSRSCSRETKGSVRTIYPRVPAVFVHTSEDQDRHLGAVRLQPLSMYAGRLVFARSRRSGISPRSRETGERWDAMRPK